MKEQYGVSFLAEGQEALLRAVLRTARDAVRFVGAS